MIFFRLNKVSFFRRRGRFERPEKDLEARLKTDIRIGHSFLSILFFSSLKRRLGTCRHLSVKLLLAASFLYI